MKLMDTILNTLTVVISRHQPIVKESELAQASRRVSELADELTKNIYKALKPNGDA